jgi:hypothetical protein
MENLIYSASPLRAFSGGIFLIIFMFVLGGVAILWALFKRREKPLPRIAMGCSSLVLLLASVGLAINFMFTLQSGDKTVVVHVNEMDIVESRCGDNGGTCTRYVIESNEGIKLYDFSVAKDAYEKIEVESCYQFTYYPARSLFGAYLQETDYSDSYESASTITRIEKVNCQ